MRLFAIKLLAIKLIVGTTLLYFSAFANVVAADPACHDLLDYKAAKLRSTEQVDFCQEFAGKAVLFVNTASQCGFTPQFKGLEKLHKEYGDKLAVVGFPSNDFKQEYSDSAKVADVCYVNYGVTFTVLEPSIVKGDDANPIFKKLAERTGSSPEWNFNKYLVSADGESVQHFGSSVKPTSPGFKAQIDQVLGE